MSETGTITTTPVVRGCFCDAADMSERSCQGQAQTVVMRWRVGPAPRLSQTFPHRAGSTCKVYIFLTCTMTKKRWPRDKTIGPGRKSSSLAELPGECGDGASAGPGDRGREHPHASLPLAQPSPWALPRSVALGEGHSDCVSHTPGL